MGRVERSLRDLTDENERLRHQVALLQGQADALQARYRTLMGATSQLVWLADTAGRLIETVQWCRYTGQSWEEAQGFGWLQAIHPDDREATERTWRRAVATGEHYATEYRLRRQDGVFRWFAARARPVLDERAHPQEWIGASRDIEDEKQLIESLRRSEDKLRDQKARIETEVVKRTKALVASEALLAEAQRLAHIGSWELDLVTGKLHWTEEQYRLFGFVPGEVEPSLASAVARIHPEDRPRYEAAMASIRAHPEAFEIDYRIVHPDGHVIDLHNIGSPVTDAEGCVIRLLGTSQDVTERKRLEEQLRRQYDELKALDQLKNNFVNSVTHELRTPLTSILGYAEFLEDEIGGPTTPSQREFVHQIQLGAKRLEYLLNDLLDFARMEAGTFTLKLEPADLGEKVREVVESLRPQAEEKHTRLEVEPPPDAMLLEMDPQRIGQVLTNLLSNAVKFTPEGGHIRIRLRRAGAAMRCEICDTGPGIAVEDLSRLFQRFVQLEAGIRMGKGAGLGLSISKALVEAHGGTIGVQSHPGEGSTFWFELPLNQPESRSEAP